MELEDLDLTSFPFGIVPPTGPTRTWADRREFRKELESMVRGWSRRSSSGIYLMWADFGAGKTHALRYLQALAEDSASPSLTVYCDLPETTSDFREVYMQIIPRVPEEALAEAVYAFRKSEGAKWLSSASLLGDYETPQALWMLAEMSGQVRGALSRKWLRAERLTSKESSQIDYLAPIRTSEQAVRILTTICKLLTLSGTYERVVLMFDEFQRISLNSRKKIHDINAGINTLFNNCPEGLAIILSYSFGTPDNIRFMVAPEVLSRVEKRYHLPRLSANDAKRFVEDLIAIHSTTRGKAKVFLPEAVDYAVRRLEQDAEGGITPRKLMQVFTAMLDEGLDENEQFPLTAAAAERLYSPPVADEF